MKIKLLSHTLNATDVAVSSARTCYSAKGLITPEASSGWDRKESLFVDLFKSGHHTTLQHSYITLGIVGASRHFIWRFLHQHQYYNSEQVSQRYTKVAKESFFSPSTANKDAYLEQFDKAYETYINLVEILTPVAASKLPKFKQDQAKKKAQEMARYVLPVGTTADLYHTINIATALRYIASAKNAFECVEETFSFVAQLEQILLDLDPVLEGLIAEAKREKPSTFEYNPNGISKIKEKFEFAEESDVFIYDISTTNIDMFGHRFNSNAYADILSSNQAMFSPEHIDGFSSILTLSLAADAQNQRHRRSIGYRAPIATTFETKYYIPPIIKETPEALSIYVEFMDQLYGFIQTEAGTRGFADIVYLLPNAHLIDIIERNDFSSFFHKAKMRLCWNAQEEIYDIVLQQIKLLKESGCDFIDLFGAPCHVRARLGIGPTCPEGIRFCGTKVWKEAPGILLRKI